MAEIPMIAYWEDIPLAELPREKLESIIIEQAGEIRRLNDHWLRTSVAHISDLARIARRQ